MSDIYDNSMSMSSNFLLQSTRVLHNDNYDEDELEMISNFMVAVDNEILNEYNNTCTILSYDNDLQLYIEIIDALINIFEEREEYEKCEMLKYKKDESIEIKPFVFTDRSIYRPGQTVYFKGIFLKKTGDNDSCNEISFSSKTYTLLLSIFQ